MTPSHAFVAQPETNGVIERLFRTFKEQVVYGRIFQTIEEVRDAVRAFVARYNIEWLVEKNGLISLAAARERWMAASPKVGRVVQAIVHGTGCRTRRGQGETAIEFPVTDPISEYVMMKKVR
jgi:hypothetical protein